jgi:hypothetical protein
MLTRPSFWFDQETSPKGEPHMSAAGKSGVQRHLTIAFPTKSPADAKALAEELPPLMADFAKVQDTLGIVHYSRFVVLGDNKTLLFLADIDGDADNLIEALAKSAGPVFDAIFGHVENPPPTPVASKSHAFFEWVTRHTAKPLTIYSACGNSSVQDIKSLARSTGITGSTEQRPLLNYLHIESGLKALTLEDLVLRATRSKMREGADSIGTLHFAHFVALPNNYLGFYTIFDGSFRKYIQDVTEKIGPVFDTLFEFVSDAPPTPVEKNANAFFKWVLANNLLPIGLYSAYPGLAVQDIKALLADAKQGAA